jgi:hypothetical protein
MKFINTATTERRARDVEARVGASVKKGRLPAWLKPRLRQEARARKLSEGFGPPSDTFILESLGARFPWFDHWGTTQRSGREVLVSEPYGLSQHNTEEFTDFCRLLGLSFEIESASYHRPTHTLRVHMWPREWGAPPKWDDSAEKQRVTNGKEESRPLRTAALPGALDTPRLGPRP